MPPIKQYVNLPKRRRNTAHGAQVKLRADVAGFLTMKNVKWEITPGGSNTDEKYLTADQRVDLEKETDSGRGNAFRNILTLPHVGKDTYTVKCKKVEGSTETQVMSKEFETWRKFYYSVHVMNDNCKQVYQNIKADFQAAFSAGGVEAEEVEVVNTTTDQPFSKVPNTAATYDFPFLYRNDSPPRLAHKPFHVKLLLLNDMKELKERYVIGKVFDKTLTDDTGDKWFVDLDKASRPASKGQKTVAEINALQAPVANDAYELNDSGDLTAGESVPVKKGHLVKFDGSKWVLHRGRWELHMKATGAFSTAGDWLKEAKFWPKGGSDVDVKAKVVKVGAGDAVREVKFKLHEVADLNDQVERGTEIKQAYIKAEYLVTTCTGFSFGNFCCSIVQGRTEQAILQTMVHEIGHGLQQVVEYWNEHDADGNEVGMELHPRQHGTLDGEGGVGSHCSYHCKLKAVGNDLAAGGTTSGNKWVWDDTAGGDTCAMYFAADPHAGVPFCDVCQNGLRRADLDKDSLIAKKWNQYG